MQEITTISTVFWILFSIMLMAPFFGLKLDFSKGWSRVYLWFMGIFFGIYVGMMIVGWMIESGLLISVY